MPVVSNRLTGLLFPPFRGGIRPADRDAGKIKSHHKAGRMEINEIINYDGIICQSIVF
jgi:hypothetical protein